MYFKTYRGLKIKWWKNIPVKCETKAGIAVLYMTGFNVNAQWDTQTDTEGEHVCVYFCVSTYIWKKKWNNVFIKIFSKL